MITLNDGPARGSYLCKRVPFFLRAVVNAGGKHDVLDLLDDAPTSDETVVAVYRLVRYRGIVHLNMVSGKGFYPSAGYESVAPTILDLPSLADKSMWMQWCTDHMPRDGSVVMP